MSNSGLAEQNSNGPTLEGVDGSAGAAAHRCLRCGAKLCCDPAL